MTHFACAIAAFFLAQVLLLTGYADPLAELQAPATLIGVHLITIGWLSLLMLGALYPFVLVGRDQAEDCASRKHAAGGHAPGRC